MLNSLRHTPAGRRSAFTLIEILIVMGIIVLMIALALPAFNFITGARSVEASSNQASAILGIARGNAIGLQQPQGVIFYKDSATDRTAMALVTVRQVPFGGWSAGSKTPAPGIAIPYAFGQYVTIGSNSFVCIQAYSDVGDSSTVPTAGSTTAYWRPLMSMTTPPLGVTNGAAFVLETTSNERQIMPVGIDVRAAGNTQTVTVSGTPSNYRYFSPAVILFDANGQLITNNYTILPEGIIGGQLNTAANVPPQTGATLVINTSQIGLIFYDDEVFKNVASGFTSAGQDAWLDQNASPVMINRYNGTMVKGE